MFETQQWLLCWWQIQSEPRRTNPPMPPLNTPLNTKGYTNQNRYVQKHKYKNTNTQRRLQETPLDRN